VNIQFSVIHNLVRTYLRVLKLEPVEPAQRVAKGTGLRVTKAAPVSRESQMAEV